MGRIEKHVLPLVIGGLLIAIVSITMFAQGPPTAVRVTDTKGYVVTLPFKNAAVTIDYSAYSFVFSTIDKLEGLRIQQGEGTVDVRWEKLSRVDVRKVTGAGVVGQIVTTTGATQEVGLVPWSKKGLEGSTELGPFTIDLDKVKTIEVIR